MFHDKKKSSQGAQMTDASQQRKRNASDMEFTECTNDDSQYEEGDYSSEYDGCVEDTIARRAALAQKKAEQIQVTGKAHKPGR